MLVPSAGGRRTVAAVPPIINPQFDPRATTQVHNGNQTEDPKTYYAMFKQFLADTRLDELARVHNAALLLGPIRSGKSTTIAIMLGSVFEQNTITNQYDLKQSPVPTPLTSHQNMSTTLHITPWRDPASGITYIDTAGINENRGREALLWTRNSLDIFFSSIKELRATVLVINYGVTLAHPGGVDAFRTQADILFEITQGVDAFYEQMLFVVTNGWNNGRRLTVDDFLRTVQDNLAQDKNTLQNKQRELQTHYTVTQLTGAVADIPEKDKEFLRKMRASIKLLETITQSRENIVMSFPIDKHECVLIKTQITNAIGRIGESQTISRDKLATLLRAKPANSLLFFNVLSGLASGYIGNLSKEAECLTEIAKIYKEKQQDVNNILRDWESVRNRLVTELLETISNKKTEISLCKKEQSAIAISTKVCMLESREVTQEKSSGLFSWCVFGGGWAEEIFEYKCSQPFVSYELVPNSRDGHYDCRVIEVSKSDGRLKLKFTSHRGFDLNVQVQISVYEKDLPSTKDRLNLLQERIDTYQSDIRQLEGRELKFRNITSANELRDEITNEKDAVVQQLRYIQRQYSTPFAELTAPADTRGNTAVRKIAEREAIYGLAKLLKMAKESNDKVHADLSDGNRSTIDDFLKLFDQIEMNAKYVQLVDPELCSVYRVNERNAEMVPPISRGLTAFLMESGLLLKRAGLGAYYQVNFSGALLRFLKDHQFPAAVCVVTFAYLWDDYKNSGILSICLKVIGLFVILVYMLKKAADARRLVLNQVEQIIREITVVASGRTDDVKEFSQFVVGKFAEKFRINVDVNGPPPTRLVDAAGLRVF